MYDRAMTARALDWIAGTTGMRRLGVLFCVAVVVVAAVSHYPSAISSANDTIARNAAFDYGDREFAGGNSVIADQAALYEARSRIPPDGTYRVVTGAKLPTFTDLTIPFISMYSTYFLLPRRQSETAPWIICYGCDATKFNNGSVVWKDDQGISIIALPR